MKDFTAIREKGVLDCDKQIVPIHLLELFGGKNLVTYTMRSHQNADCN